MIWTLFTSNNNDSYWKSSIFSNNTPGINNNKNINSLANSYIQSSKKRMNSSIIKLTIPPPNINPSSRLNQTTMILFKPGKNGEPDSKLSTYIDYLTPNTIRPYTSSELKRITNLGPVPKVPDLSEFYVHKTNNNDDDNNSQDDTDNQEALSEILNMNMKKKMIMMKKIMKKYQILNYKLKIECYRWTWR